MLKAINKLVVAYEFVVKLGTGFSVSLLNYLNKKNLTLFLLGNLVVLIDDILLIPFFFICELFLDSFLFLNTFFIKLFRFVLSSFLMTR